MTTLTERAVSIFAAVFTVIFAFAAPRMFRKRRTRGAVGVTTTAALVAVLMVVGAGMEWAPSAYSQTTALDAPPATPTASAEPQAEEERIVPGESFFVLTLVAAVFGGVLIVLARRRRRFRLSPPAPPAPQAPLQQTKTLDLT